MPINTDDSEGRRMLEQSLALARAAGDTLIEHCTLKGLGAFAQVLRDYDRAEGLYMENVRLCRETGDLANLSLTLGNLAELHMDRQQFRQALSYAEAGMEVARRINDAMSEFNLELLISEITHFLGDLPRSLAAAQNSLAMVRERFPEEEQTVPLTFMGKTFIAMGAYRRAQTLLEQALRINQKWFKEPPIGRYSLVYNVMACVAACQDQARRAAILFGAADGEIHLVKGFRPTGIDWEYQPFIAKVCAAMGEQEFEAARAEGRAMTREQAVEYALQGE